MLLPFFAPSLSHADALSLNKIADLSFGTIDFADPTASGNITMGTNGTITYGNNTSGNGTGTAGQIEITGDVGVTLTIACSTSASLGLPGQPSLPITPLGFVIGTGNVGPLNAATECTGEDNSVTTHTISAIASENIIFVSGILAINGLTLTNATYLGSNSGGTQPFFRVLVQ